MEASSIGRYVLVGATAAVIAAILALFISLLQPAKYRAQMGIAVGSGTSVVTPDFGDQLQPVTSTVAQLIKTNVVAEKVIKERKLKISSDTFIKRLDVSTKPDAALIDVTYDSKNRSEAVAVLQTIGRIFPTLLDEPVKKDATAPTGATAVAEAEAAARSTSVRTTVFDPPHLLPDKISPRPFRNAVIAGFLGLLLGIGWVAIRDSREPEERTGRNDLSRKRRREEPEDELESA